MLQPRKTKQSGDGQIHVSIQPGSRPVLSTFEFSYPLKLISSAPSSLCQTVFLLSYGGGLVAGDEINLQIRLDPGAKLSLLTQGATKIFKCPPTEPGTIPLTRQTINTTLSPGSAFLLLPDPLQPHATSNYLQRQAFTLPPDNTASLLVLDWVTEGRTALNEHWSLHRFESRNEILEIQKDGRRKLMVRDVAILEGDDEENDIWKGGSLLSRMEGVTVFATLMIRGPVFAALSSYALELFKTEPRVGGRRGRTETEAETERRRRSEGVIWTVAEVRGITVVRVQGRELEVVRRWLKRLVEEEGRESCVVKEFGKRALMCLE